MFKTRKSKKLKAFTLVEVLVSMFLFITIAMILTQIYVSTIRAERIAYILLRDENIIRNELESLARDIRMGREFFVEDGGNSLNYRTYYDERTETDDQTYYHDAWQRISYKFNKETLKIEKSIYNIIGSEDSKVVSSDYKQVIPDSIQIDSLNFYINQDPGEQLSVTITLTLSSIVYSKTYTTKLQTTVTPRMLDL
jgi:type II secretory pathway pseudopilin PulG